MSMKLNADILNFYGLILSSAFAEAAAGKENSPNYITMENKYKAIMKDIMGFPDDNSTSSDKLFECLWETRLISFNMIMDTYSIEEIVDTIRVKASCEELKFCKNTLIQFVRDLATNFNCHDIARNFTLLADSFE